MDLKTARNLVEDRNLPLSSQAVQWLEKEMERLLSEANMAIAASADKVARAYEIQRLITIDKARKQN